jgi:hypothetical protein
MKSSKNKKIIRQTCAEATTLVEHFKKLDHIFTFAKRKYFRLMHEHMGYLRRQQPKQLAN